MSALTLYDVASLNLRTCQVQTVELVSISVHVCLSMAMLCLLMLTFWLLCLRMPPCKGQICVFAIQANAEHAFTEVRINKQKRGDSASEERFKVTAERSSLSCGLPFLSHLIFLLCSERGSFRSVSPCMSVCMFVFTQYLCKHWLDAQCSGLLDESFLGAKTVDTIGMQVLPCCCFVSVCICYLATDYTHTHTRWSLYFNCNCFYFFFLIIIYNHEFKVVVQQNYMTCIILRDQFGAIFSSKTEELDSPLCCPGVQVWPQILILGYYTETIIHFQLIITLLKDCFSSLFTWT